MGFGSFTRLGTMAWESRGPSPRSSPQAYHTPARKVREDELYGMSMRMDGMADRHENIQNRHEELADLLGSFSRQQPHPTQSRFGSSEDDLNERYMRGEETPWTTGRPVKQQPHLQQPAAQLHPPGQAGPEDMQRQAAQSMMQQFAQAQMGKAKQQQAEAQTRHDNLPQEQLKRLQAENAQLRQRCLELETQNGHLLEYYEVTIHIVRAAQAGQMGAAQGSQQQNAQAHPQQQPQAHSHPQQQPKPFPLQNSPHPRHASPHQTQGVDGRQPTVPEQARPQQREDPRLQQLREQHLNQHKFGPVPSRHEIPGLTHSPDDDEFYSDEEDDPRTGGARPWW